ncbi:MAG TPA: hypothetical protein VFB22_05055 [Candidatus Baltobacteraceae bacterium]|nr:hypothetical protein [Candidatus Baltobacteraceae bacterium]
MYVEAGALRALGLEVSEAAILMVKRARKCAICTNPRPPRGLYKNDALARWANEMHERVGNTVIPIPHDDRCPVCEADLKPVIGIPLDILVGIHKRLSEPQRRFLENRFVFPVCEACRTNNREETDRTIREHYRRVVGKNGAQPDDRGIAEEIFGLIAQETSVLRLGYRG